VALKLSVLPCGEKNLIKKRAKRGKFNIRSWRKMTSKHEDRFLPPFYL